VDIPAGHGWVVKMLRNLGTEQTAGFTVSDWAEEFDLQPNLIVQVLDTLSQAGFVVPDSKP